MSQTKIDVARLVTGILPIANGGTGTALGAAGSVGPGTDQLFAASDRVLSAPWTLGQENMVSGVTVSIATPAVVTFTNTFVASQPVRFTTTGALPTGLDVNTVYYVSATGLSGTSFQLSLTVGGASINTSGTQSGVHSLGKVKSYSMSGPLTLVGTLTFSPGSRLAII